MTKDIVIQHFLLNVGYFDILAIINDFNCSNVMFCVKLCHFIQILFPFYLSTSSPHVRRIKRTYLSRQVGFILFNASKLQHKPQ